MKSFKSTAWILPQPVLIIGTYDKGGACDVDNITGGHLVLMLQLTTLLKTLNSRLLSLLKTP